MHVEGGLVCVARGLPVLVEKPFAVSVAEGLALVKAAEFAGVPLLTGHHCRHCPLIVAARRLFEEGALGRPVSAHGMFWLAKPDDYFDAPFRIAAQKRLSRPSEMPERLAGASAAHST